VKKNILILSLGLLFIFPFISNAENTVVPEIIVDVVNEEKVDIYLFEHEGCAFCAKEMSFFENLAQERDDFNLIIVDIGQKGNRQQFDLITDEYNLPKSTPITIVGNHIFQGFDSSETTGIQIINFIEQSKKGEENGIITQATTTADTTMLPEQSFDFKIPFLGVINLKDFSLFSLSAILGLVDGFNPCAMWVLMTFLLILWQVKDKKKMFQVVSLFIIAEAVMYWLILNFWYQAWDFIALDKIVTPLIGLLALGGGLYFLFRYFKNRGKLVCDTDVQKQSKTESKIQRLILAPLTFVTALGIIGVAFSVNIVEFACSVGIPQAFTKILEINNLNMFVRQFYIGLYTLFYMVDDFIIFGLALYGFKKFYTVGQKYSNLSSLIGGILMLILGALLIFAPNLLVF